MTNPKWSNTLNYNFKYWGHVSKFWEELVVPSNYPFFLWNDRVYKVSPNRDDYEDTGFILKDLE